MPVDLPFNLDLNGDVASMTSRTTVNRQDFGIGQSMSDEASLGFTVDILIDVTATRAAAAE